MRLCIRCQAIKKTCCQENPQITLTTGDVRRISQATGLNDFYEFKHYPDLSFMAVYDYDPNWRKYAILPGNRNRLLKMDSSGQCVFLGADGCVLSVDTRPLVCRLYPYNYNEFGMIGFYASKDLWCPVHLLKEGEALSNMLQMTREQANQWRIMYDDELGADDKERNHAKSAS